MPIEIRELIIKATVDNSSNDTNTQEPQAENTHTVSDEDFFEDMELVIEMIKNKNER